MSSELTLDVISTQVDHDIYQWMLDAAATADDPDQIGALVAGVMAGLTRYMWSIRQDDATPERIASMVRDSVLNMAQQAADHDVGGRA